MYAIVRKSGKQYRIVEGDEIICDRVKGKVGDSVKFDKILLVNDEGKTIVNNDELSKYQVKAELVEHFADEKIQVFKYKPKKGYRRLNGHRQQKTRIKISAIGTGKAVAKKSAVKKKVETVEVKAVDKEIKPEIAKEKTVKEVKPAEKSKPTKITEKPKKTAAKPKKTTTKPKETTSKAKNKKEDVKKES